MCLFMSFLNMSKMIMEHVGLSQILFLKSKMKSVEINDL